MYYSEVGRVLVVCRLERITVYSVRGKSRLPVGIEIDVVISTWVGI